VAAGLITLAKIDIENITQWNRWLERLVRLVGGVPSSCLSSARANELLGWFHKRILPELFVGKMLVRKHGYEIERFHPGIPESVRHPGWNPHHIWSFHCKSPIADHVLNLAVQNSVRFLTLVRMQRRARRPLGSRSG